MNIKRAPRLIFPSLLPSYRLPQFVWRQRGGNLKVRNDEKTTILSREDDLGRGGYSARIRRNASFAFVSVDRIEIRSRVPAACVTDPISVGT